MEFMKRFLGKRPALFKSGQWHFHQDNAPVHNFIFVTDYLTKMGIKTVPHPPYRPDLAPCDFCLYPKLRGCRYETIKEMKEAVTLPIVQTLLSVTFAYSLSSRKNLEAVVMRKLRRWKRLWRRSLTRSHKRSSTGPSRSCWNGTTSALQPGKITSKGTRVSCVYYQ